MKPKSSKTVGTQTIHSVADQLTRSDHQLRKIRPSSSPSVHFHRDGVSDSYQYRQSTSGQANEDIGVSQNVFYQKTSVSARDFLSLLGQLNAAADLVMLGRLHLRPLQISLPNQWKPQNLPYSHQIGLTTEILQHLKLWLQEDLYHQGNVLKIDPPPTPSLPMPAYQAGEVMWNRRDFCFMDYGQKTNPGSTSMC